MRTLVAFISHHMHYVCTCSALSASTICASVIYTMYVVYEALVCIFVLLLHTYPHTHTHAQCVYKYMHMLYARCAMFVVGLLSCLYACICRRISVCGSALCLGEAHRRRCRCRSWSSGKQTNTQTHGARGKGGTEASSCTYNTCI